MKNINYALVEEKRPPLYTAMKYWGKKPHNIWYEYIKTYTNGNNLYLDPFSGSAMSAFEAVKANKKAFCFDINPLTSFMVDVLCTKFNEKTFVSKLEEIVAKVEKDETYKFLYNYNDDSAEFVIQNFKWENNQIYQVGLFSKTSNRRELRDVVLEDYLHVEPFELEYWYPKQEFPEMMDLNNDFRLKTLNRFSSLWTKRNLYVLSLIFDNILSINDEIIKKQLLYGFIQTLHLSSKMCVPRRKSANRAFSTSWGRSAFMLPKRHMEMNPLLLFKNSCIGKQSVSSALKSVKKHVGKVPKAKFVDEKINKEDYNEFDIFYGIQDIKKLGNIIPRNEIDFIMTDPAYGGLVKYLDLSSIWLVWLEKYNVRYKVNYDDEITIKKGKVSTNNFESDLTKGFTILNQVLKDNGKIVFTFHNSDIQVWNSFLKSIANSGFIIEKVIHQQNKRSGESNVKDQYGSSSNDFYIRCVKGNYLKLNSLSRKDTENIILERIIDIISKRNEPTNYQIIFNALLVTLSENKIYLDNFDSKINEFLESHIGSVFEVIDGQWWIINKKYYSNSSKTLTNRVKKFIDNELLKDNSINLDALYKKIYKRFPNGLTPDIKVLKSIMKDIENERKKSKK